VAISTVSYSAEVTHQAARTYFWRRFKSPLGVMYLISLPLVLALVIFTYSYEGANWAVGVFGFLLVMNVMLQGSLYFSQPRAVSRLLSDPSRQTLTLETLEDGFKAEAGRNTTFFPWTKLRHIWLYRDFILLVPAHPMLLSRFWIIPTAGMSAEVWSDFEKAGRTPRSPNNRVWTPPSSK
jgi:hypothetical protein